MTHNNDSHQQEKISSPPAGDLYRLLFEEAADSMFIADSQGQLLTVNAKAIELTGYSDKELQGMNFSELIPPEDLARDPIPFEDLAMGKLLIKERRIRRKDGSLVWVENRVRMLPEGNLLGVTIDISNRKQAEERLLLTQFAVDQAPEAIFWMTPDAGFFYVNEAACQSLGYTRQELFDHDRP